MDLIDFTGARVPLLLQCGSSAGQTWTNIYQADEVTQITTITAARISFREGFYTDKVAGTLVAITITPTVTSGSQIAWSMTPAQSRLFTPGNDYWYQIEFDTADGGTWTLVKDVVAAQVEGVP